MGRGEGAPDPWRDTHRSGARRGVRRWSPRRSGPPRTSSAGSAGSGATRCSSGSSPRASCERARTEGARAVPEDPLACGRQHPRAQVRRQLGDVLVRGVDPAPAHRRAGRAARARSDLAHKVVDREGLPASSSRHEPRRSPRATGRPRPSRTRRRGPGGDDRGGRGRLTASAAPPARPAQLKSSSAVRVRLSSKNYGYDASVDARVPQLPGLLAARGLGDHRAEERGAVDVDRRACPRRRRLRPCPRGGS